MNNTNRNIFISVACFLDPDIEETVSNCLSMARHPDRIVFGVCLQEDPEKPLLTKFIGHPQFRFHRMHYNEAKGPTYARYFCSQLLRDERYFLQIDCHTRFVKDWDRIILKCLHQCNDKRAIITNFPLSVTKLDGLKTKNTNPPLNKSTRKFRLLSLDGIKLGSTTCQSQVPLQTYYLSAAFLFGRSTFIVRVPLDPFLTFSYQTIEQQFYAIRLFTHGWNLYMPTRHILATNYQKTIHYNASGERIVAPSNKVRGKLSWQRVLYYYGLKPRTELSREVNKSLTKYGLGKERSLQDFFSANDEPDCLNKLLAGERYVKGKWVSGLTYVCRNPLLQKAFEKQGSLFTRVDNAEQPLDLVWDMKSTSVKHRLQHYPMKQVSFIDNKRTFFKLLHGLTYGYPETFFSYDTFLQGYTKGANYFLKYAGNNGGKQVHVCNTPEQVQTLLQENDRPYVIQKEIQNLLLYQNRKFVLRIWMVLIGDRCFLSTQGNCMVQISPYQKGNLDRKIHIEHKPDTVEYLPYNKRRFYHQSYRNVLKLCHLLMGRINTRLVTNPQCFQLLGLDIIFDQSLTPFIIEINAWPNMVINDQVDSGNKSEVLAMFLTDLAIPTLLQEPLNKNQYFKEIKS